VKFDSVSLFVPVLYSERQMLKRYCRIYPSNLADTGSPAHVMYYMVFTIVLLPRNNQKVVNCVELCSKLRESLFNLRNSIKEQNN